MDMYRIPAPPGIFALLRLLNKCPLRASSGRCLITNPQASLHQMLLEYLVLWDKIDFTSFSVPPDSDNDSDRQTALELQFTLEKPL